MKSPDIPIPERCADLPRWEGWIIPFFTQVTDGRPDFAVVDNRKVTKCLVHELCGICGKPLDRIMCFIGGELCAENKVFSDPPMHEECARYAAKVCPFLNGTNRKYRSTPTRSERSGVTVRNPFVSQHRPRRMMLYFTDSFNLVMLEGGHRGIQAGRKVKKTDWKAMPESKPGTLEWSKSEKDTLVADVRSDLKEHAGGLPPAYACFSTAFFTVLRLYGAGIRASIQGGSRQWPIIPPEKDDGECATHLSWMWSPTDLRTLESLAAGRAPEVHCWVGIPESGELIDLTTCHLKENAADAGLVWRVDEPPDYIWVDGFGELPEDVVYLAELEATEFVNTMCKTLFIDKKSISGFTIAGNTIVPHIVEDE